MVDGVTRELVIIVDSVRLELDPLLLGLKLERHLSSGMSL